MKQAINILLAYLTCNDPAVKNKYLNILNSFWHKDEGILLKEIQTNPEGDVTFIWFDGDGNNYDTTIEKFELPANLPTNYHAELKIIFDTKEDRVPGKGLSTNDFTNTLKNKLDSLSNYVHPATHEISEINGLQIVLDDKVAKEGNKVLTDVNFSQSDKDKLDNLAGVHSSYATITDLLADQVNHLEGYILEVTDASEDATVDSGYAYYKRLATESLTLADYRKLSEQESMDLVPFSGNYDDLTNKPSPITKTSDISTNDGDGVIPEDKYLLESKFIEGQTRTIFIDAVNGSDTDGKIENRLTPFKTIAAANSALPVDDDSRWTFIFLTDGTYPVTNTFDQRDLTFRSAYACTIDFSDKAGNYYTTGDTGANPSHHIWDIPNGHWKCDTTVNNFYIYRNHAGSFTINAKTITAKSSQTSFLYEIDKVFIDCETLNIKSTFVNGRTGVSDDCHIKAKNIVATGNTILVQVHNGVIIDFNNATSTGRLTIIGLNCFDVICNFGDYNASSSYYAIYTRIGTSTRIHYKNCAKVVNGYIQTTNAEDELIITGSVDFTGSFFFGNQGAVFTLVNFFGKFSSHIQRREQGSKWKMYDSSLVIGGNYQEGGAIGVTFTSPFLKVYGHCSIQQTTPNNLFNFNANATGMEIEVNGKLTSNSTGIDADITITNNSNDL